MPQRPLTLCAEPGCRALVRGGRCPTHRREQTHIGNQVDDEQRRAAWRFYSSTRWKRMRRLVLSTEPLCAQCKRDGRLTPASEVDHIVPRETDPTRAFDMTNLQGLCKQCHSRKTLSETNAQMASSTASTQTLPPVGGQYL